MVRSLPEYASNTRQLPSEVLALRETFQNAKSPERFLFVAVPGALGLPEFSERKPRPGEIEAFFDLLNGCLRQWSMAMPRILDEARDTLLAACGFPRGDSGWDPLRQEAVRLEPMVTEPQLLAFVRRVAQAGSGRQGVESVCALVASRPPGNWTDADAARFPDAARAIGKAFRESSAAVANQRAGGEVLTQLEPGERKRADELLRRLRAQLDKTAKQESPRVIRAVLAELVREMVDHNERTSESSYE